MQRRSSDLRAAVNGLGPGTSPADKVEDVQAALFAHRTPEARTLPNTLIHELDAQAGKRVDTETAAAHIADAKRIRAVLAC